LGFLSEAEGVAEGGTRFCRLRRNVVAPIEAECGCADWGGMLLRRLRRNVVAAIEAERGCALAYLLGVEILRLRTVVRKGFYG
jgi:hypothetical protein